MLQPLSAQQQAWVNQTLSTLSIEQSLAQLLNVSQPMDKEQWVAFMANLPVGAMSARVPNTEVYRDLLVALQAVAPVPLLVIANMEHGAAEWKGYGTDFPSLMAAGAANDPELIAQLGKATAVEARHVGVNWVLTPVVDLNYNFDNPVTNIRAFGDRPEQVAALATTLIAALQAHGVAATAKHFPGDGIDSRDQHLVTTINYLPFDQWMATYGLVWKRVIDGGVWTIMPGHISLPAYQGFFDHPEDAPPATVARELLETLLRQELGFAGLIVSDATGMIGFASRMAPEKRAVAAVNAGIDLYLGANPQVDYPALLAAVKTGELREERVLAATRRVLELKARLGLAEQFFGPAPSPAESQAFAQAAAQMAEKSITLVRNDGRHPISPTPAAKILTVTVMPTNTMIPHSDLTIFDEELVSRGFQVEHLLNPRSDELRARAQESDLVFVNVYVAPMMNLGTIRVTFNTFGTWGWRALFTEHPNVYYTSFGNPYLTFELPHAPVLAVTYGGNGDAQRAAVKFWLGESEAHGTLPVTLPKVKIQPLP